MLEISEAHSPPQYARVRELMGEYIEWDRRRTRELGVDPDAMYAFYYPGDFELPGAFAPPEHPLASPASDR